MGPGGRCQALGKMGMVTSLTERGTAGGRGQLQDRQHTQSELKRWKRQRAPRELEDSGLWGSSEEPPKDLPDKPNPSVV